MSLKMLFLGNPVMVMDNQCSVLYDQKQCVQGSALCRVWCTSKLFFCFTLKTVYIIQEKFLISFQVGGAILGNQIFKC